MYFLSLRGFWAEQKPNLPAAAIRLSLRGLPAAAIQIQIPRQARDDPAGPDCFDVD